jgi:hypothetical protein
MQLFWLGGTLCRSLLGNASIYRRHEGQARNAAEADLLGLDRLGEAPMVLLKGERQNRIASSCVAA